VLPGVAVVRTTGETFEVSKEAGKLSQAFTASGVLYYGKRATENDQKVSEKLIYALDFSKYSSQSGRFANQLAI
jgi:hypothetical protein